MYASISRATISPSIISSKTSFNSSANQMTDGLISQHDKLT